MTPGLATAFFRQGFAPFDGLVGRLADDPTPVVETLAARTARNLLEIAHLQVGHLAAVELGQLGEEHSSDRDVDADAERIRAGNDLQEAFLGELFDLQPIPGEQASVVYADAEGQEALELPTVGGVETSIADGLGDGGALFAGRKPGRGQSLRELGAVVSREVDDVDGRLFVFEQLGDRLVQGVSR